MTVVYKICPEQLWRDAERERLFRGVPVDRRDGFIHFSTASQIAGTAAKHFAGQDDLLLIAVHSDLLGPALKWEASRGGDLFPHLYGELPLSAVAGVFKLRLGGDGRHLFPDGLR